MTEKWDVCDSIIIKAIITQVYEQLRDIFIKSQKIGKEKWVLIYQEDNKIRLSEERTGSGTGVRVERHVDIKGIIGDYHTHLPYPPVGISLLDVFYALADNHLLTCIGDMFGITFYIYDIRKTGKLREDIINVVEYLERIVSIAISTHDIENIKKINTIIDEVKEEYYEKIKDSRDQLFEKIYTLKWKKVIT